MTKFAHRLYIITLAIIVIVAITAIVFKGNSFYQTKISDRFLHPDYEMLKPSGIIGHGLGIMGSLFMLLGVSLYMIRKRYKVFFRLGVLKHWLEFHIFLCTLGPILVLFHTSFKFGGIVAISFWSMVAVFLSGIIGRFIYIQIPRTIEGRELSLNEIKNLKKDIGLFIKEELELDEESFNLIVDSVKKKIKVRRGFFIINGLRNYKDELRTIRIIKMILRKNKVSKELRTKVLKLVRNDISLNRRIERLTLMQNLFKYWHVIHLPFALIMLVIMILHVAVTLVFGYKWIF